MRNRETGHFYLNERYLEIWWQRSRLDESGCWIWEGPVGKAGGYGHIGFRGKVMYLHRAAFILFFGEPAGEDVEVHHTCFNRRCWRPDHLVPMKKEAHKSLHGLIPLQQCKHVHEMTEANRIPRTDQPGRYRCRLCHSYAMEKHRFKDMERTTPKRSDFGKPRSKRS